MNQKALRAIPSVEKILQALGDTGLPRSLMVTAVRRHVAQLRKSKRILEFEEVVTGVRTSLDGLKLSRMQPVINGTGILINTNLGRAPLGPAVVETLEAIGANYNNLEFDLATGERGGRASYVEQCLATLCNAEAVTVTNNCAAALILILRHFVGGTDQRLVTSLTPEVRVRALESGQSPEHALDSLRSDMESIRRFIKGRRAFLLRELRQ